MKSRNWISKILLAWFILSFVTAAFFTEFLKAAWAEEILHCEEPREWGKVYDSQERWGGPDPTVTYRRGSDNIKVTHYGLKDSEFTTVPFPHVALPQCCFAAKVPGSGLELLKESDQLRTSWPAPFFHFYK